MFFLNLREALSYARRVAKQRGFLHDWTETVFNEDGTLVLENEQINIKIVVCQSFIGECEYEGW